LARLIGQEDPFADFAGGARPRARPAAPEPRAARPESRSDWRDAYRARESDSAHDRTGDGRAPYSYGASRRDRDEHPIRAARAEPAHARRPEPDDSAYDDARADAYDPEYSDDAYLPEHSGDIVETSRPGKGRRIAIYAVALVIGVGVVGGAGVFGYRAIFGPTMSKTPPVISPQAGPNKVVPPTAAATPEATKQIYDRLGPEPATNERIVPRAETPIDVAARTGRMPTPDSPATPADPQPVATTPTATAPTPANLGPRRVRTVTVRADGTIVDSPPATPAAPIRTAPAPRPAQPLAVNTYAPTGDQPQPETPRSRTPVATAPAAPTPPPSSGPVWPPLQPQTAARPTAPVSQQVRVQTQAPTIQTPQASGYVVQVSSQRSEAEAQAAWRALQARYSAVLGSRQATIHRADLGERGTFYRAQVGPFGSRDEANRLCQNLKSAGGECIVQRN
jgi:hypothetical protein